jgi:hypothetical protein
MTILFGVLQQLNVKSNLVFDRKNTSFKTVELNVAFKNQVSISLKFSNVIE